MFNKKITVIARNTFSSYERGTKKSVMNP